MSETRETKRPAPQTAAGPRPGICVPWEEKRKEFPGFLGDEEVVRRVWEANEALAYTYIWQCLLSF